VLLLIFPEKLASFFLSKENEERKLGSKNKTKTTHINTASFSLNTLKILSSSIPEF